VPFGNYTITEVLQSGWTQTAPPGGYYLVNMTSGTLVNTGLNFTNMEIPKSGNISGIKFNDLNGDGHRDVNDVPLSGWVINLFYQNGTLFGTRTTDASGQFVFDPVPQGLYNLTEVQKDGWTQTAPPGGYYLIQVNDTALNFTLNFGNQEIPNPCSCPTNAFFTWVKASSPAHTIKFTDASTGTPISWMWSFGDGKFSNVRNPTHTYSRAGTYKVMLSIQSCDCSGATVYTYYSQNIRVT
jgi:PKD repeat protein